MRTKISIVYETLTGQIRRIIVPDADHQLDAHKNIGKDETLIIEYYSGPIDQVSIAALIQRKTGQMR